MKWCDRRCGNHSEISRAFHMMNHPTVSGANLRAFAENELFSIWQRRRRPCRFVVALQLQENQFRVRARRCLIQIVCRSSVPGSAAALVACGELDGGLGVARCE